MSKGIITKHDDAIQQKGWMRSVNVRVDRLQPVSKIVDNAVDEAYLDFAIASM